MRPLRFRQPCQYSVCQLMFLFLPDKVRWYGSAVSKLEEFAQFNCQGWLYESNSTTISRTSVIDASGFRHHCNVLWLKGNWQCSTSICQVIHVDRVFRLGQQFREYNRQIVTVNKVAFTATMRHVRKLFCIATCCISFQPREEKFQKLFLCKNTP